MWGHRIVLLSQTREFGDIMLTVIFIQNEIELDMLVLLGETDDPKNHSWSIAELADRLFSSTDTVYLQVITEVLKSLYSRKQVVFFGQGKHKRFARASSNFVKYGVLEK